MKAEADAGMAVHERTVVGASVEELAGAVIAPAEEVGKASKLSKETVAANYGYSRTHQ